jgi:hypothetical protein
MKNLWTVALREIQERRMLWAAALAAGLLPLAAPWLPAFERHDPAELRGVAAGALLLVLTLLLAPVLGSSMLGRELAEGRLGFYFRRPVRAWVLWLGKVVGAAVLVFGAQLLLLLPVLSATGGGASLWDTWGLEPATALAGLAAGTALLLLLGHLCGVALRSRSLWLLADLAALVVVVLTGWSLSVRLLTVGAMRALVYGWEVGLAGLVVSLLLAGAVGTVRGRVDLARTHRALSLTLWSAVAVVLAGFAGWVGWVLHPAPADLARLERAVPAPAGDWVMLQGPVDGRPSDSEPVFFADTAGGRFVRASTTGLVTVGSFSPDGRRAVWVQLSAYRPEEGGEVVTVDLTAPRPAPVATGISPAGWVQRLELSPSGGRLAMVEGSRLSILELPGGRLLASARLPEETFSASLLWPDESRVRLLVSRWSEGSLGHEAYELSVEGTWRHTASVEPGKLSDGRSLDPTGRWMLHWGQESAQEPRITDLETGETRTDLPFSAASPWRSGVFLADGRIVLAEAAPEGAAEGAVVRWVNRSGEEEASLAWPGAGPLRILGEALPGLLVITGDLPGKASRGLLELRDPGGRSARWWRLADDVVSLPRDFWFHTRGSSPFFTAGRRGLLRLTPQMGWEVILPPDREVPPPELMGDLAPVGSRHGGRGGDPARPVETPFACGILLGRFPTSGTSGQREPARRAKQHDMDAIRQSLADPPRFGAGDARSRP